LCVIFVIILCVGCSNPKRTITHLPKDAIILAFGDSLTYGMGKMPQESFPTELARLSGYEVVNAGVPGEITEEALQRLPNLMKKYSPLLVILCHGGNDMLRHISTEKIQSNLESMIETIQSYGAKVILVGIPRLGLSIKTAPLYYRIAKSKRIPFEQKIIAEVLSTPSLKSDYIHPNEKGYKKIAEALMRLLPERI
jgi:lysophospholipase L1-like esterase